MAILISPADPDVQAYPEAIEAVYKFLFFREFGWAETMRSFDSIPYYDYEMMMSCMSAMAKKEKMDADRMQFYSKEAALL